MSYYILHNVGNREKTFKYFIIISNSKIILSLYIFRKIIIFQGHYVNNCYDTITVLEKILSCLSLYLYDVMNRDYLRLRYDNI